ARRTALRAALAAAGARIDPRRAAGAAATLGSAWLLQGHAGRPVRRRDAAGAAQLPGLDRRPRRRIRDRGRAGTAARPLNGAVFAAKVTFNALILLMVSIGAAEARFFG